MLSSGWEGRATVSGSQQDRGLHVFWITEGIPNIFRSIPTHIKSQSCNVTQIKKDVLIPGYEVSKEHETFSSGWECCHHDTPEISFSLFQCCSWVVIEWLVGIMSALVHCTTSVGLCREISNTLGAAETMKRQQGKERHFWAFCPQGSYGIFFFTLLLQTSAILIHFHLCESIFHSAWIHALNHLYPFGGAVWSVTKVIPYWWELRKLGNTWSARLAQAYHLFWARIL